MRDYTEKFTENVSKGRELFVTCRRCSGETRHEVKVSLDVVGELNNGLVDWEESFQVVQCKGCEDVAFRKVHIDSESIDLDDNDELVRTATINIFPPRIAGKEEPEDFFRLPPAVGRIYSETRSALVNDQAILAGIGIRSLIETICKEKEASGYTLENKIDGLVTMGVLTRENASMLHKLRILGNEAAHEVVPHSKPKLFLALEIVETLLKNVYILPMLAEKLRD